MRRTPAGAPERLRPWSLAQLHAGRHFKFGDRLRAVDYLDRGHAHGARGLQVDAEIVKIHAMLRIDAERFRHHLVDTWIWLAQADLRRLDDVIEQHHDLRAVDRPAALAADRVGRKVVGDAAGLEPGLHAPQRFEHFGARSPDSSG